MWNKNHGFANVLFAAVCIILIHKVIGLDSGYDVSSLSFVEPMVIGTPKGESAPEAEAPVPAPEAPQAAAPAPEAPQTAAAPAPVPPPPVETVPITANAPVMTSAAAPAAETAPAAPAAEAGAPPAAGVAEEPATPRWTITTRQVLMPPQNRPSSRQRFQQQAQRYGRSAPGWNAPPRGWHPMPYPGQYGYGAPNGYGQNGPQNHPAWGNPWSRPGWHPAHPGY